MRPLFTPRKITHKREKGITLFDSEVNIVYRVIIMSSLNTDMTVRGGEGVKCVRLLNSHLL